MANTGTTSAAAVICSLLVATALAATPVLSLAQGAAADDEREVVIVRPKERTRILGEMRKYLGGLQEINDALSKEEWTVVAATARTMGTIAIYDVISFMPRARTQRFREIGFSVHDDFDRIAADAEKLKDARHTLRQLSVTMKKCVLCHESYQLRDSAHGQQ